LFGTTLGPFFGVVRDTSRNWMSSALFLTLAVWCRAVLPALSVAARPARGRDPDTASPMGLHRMEGPRSIAGATGLSLRHIAGLASQDELRGLFNASGPLGVRAAPCTSRYALLEPRTRRWSPRVIESGEASP